jgi:CheY-like chemotaxis protein
MRGNFDEVRAMQRQTGILIADDSENDVALFKHAWQIAGARIPYHHVLDGADAMTYLEQACGGSRPDRTLPRLVLIDLKMPRVSGFELLTYLQQRKDFCSVLPLVWSNSSEIDDVKKAYELGARCFLPKPGSARGWQMLMERLHEFHQSQLKSVEPD